MIDLSILAAFGIVLTIGVIGSNIFKRIHFPEILGFMLVGLILNVFLTLLNHNVIITDFLDLVVAITLGFIGFNLGSELDWKTIRSMSLKIIVILLFEALLTFVLVTIVIYTCLGFSQFQIALLFGALASATAPAGTAAIFWENDAKGPLTTATMFILALDDIVAIILTEIALDYNILVYEKLKIDLFSIIMPVLFDVGTSLILGVVVGLIVAFLLNREETHSEYVDFVIGAVLVCIGVAAILDTSYILPTMVFGVVVSSLCKNHMFDITTKEIIEDISDHVSPNLLHEIYEKRRKSREDEPHQIFHEVYRLTSPVIAMFFVLIGLSLDLSAIGQIGIIGIGYIIARSVSKAVGASIGAFIVKAETSVQKYLGPCLFSQAGVALGLAVIVSEHLAKFGEAASGLLILTTITATTIIFQIFGPLAIKWAIARSGESRVKMRDDHLHFPMFEWAKNNK